MRLYKYIIIIAAVAFSACSDKDNKYDASGNFEADEVIVSAEQNGKLLSFNVTEGGARIRPE